MTIAIEQNQQNITGAVVNLNGDALVRTSLKPAEPVPPPAIKLSEGWHDNAFYFAGQKFVVAIGPEISKNGLHELHTYRYEGDKQAVPSDKLTTIVTKPLTQPEPSSYATDKSVTAPTTDKKCLFCGKTITWGNSKTKYCCDACKTREYRKHKEAVTA